MIKFIESIESVQRRATKLIPKIKTLTYPERHSEELDNVVLVVIEEELSQSNKYLLKYSSFSNALISLDLLFMNSQESAIRKAYLVL